MEARDFNVRLCVEGTASVFIQGALETRVQQHGRVYHKGSFHVWLLFFLFFFLRSCKVLFVCLPTTLHWFSEFFLFFFFLPLLNTRAQQRRFTLTLPLFTEKKGGGANQTRPPPTTSCLDTPLSPIAQTASQQQQQQQQRGLKCKECASVHKLYLSL